MNIRDEAHEIFALAKLLPDEGIEDATDRIADKLETIVQQSLSGSDDKPSSPKCEHHYTNHNEGYAKCRKCGHTYVL